VLPVRHDDPCRGSHRRGPQIPSSYGEALDASGRLLPLVLRDLMGPSRSHAGFGSRRGRLSHSHDRVRSETRNKPASPTRPVCSLSLGYLGAINFPPRHALHVILRSDKQTYSMLQHSQCARYSLSWGLGAYFIVRDQNGEKSREGAALPQALIRPLATAIVSRYF
jgi:hypothetical protein